MGANTDCCAIAISAEILEITLQPVILIDKTDEFENSTSHVKGISFGDSISETVSNTIILSSCNVGGTLSDGQRITVLRSWVLRTGGGDDTYTSVSYSHANMGDRGSSKSHTFTV